MNMDPQTMTIAIKGAGMVALIGGGILALSYGFRLFSGKHGTQAADLALDLGPLKATARSVGSVVMVTAVGWGFLGDLINPSFEKTAGTIRIYSFSTPGGDEVLAPALSVKLKQGEQRGLDALFAEGLKTLPPNKINAQWFAVAGMPASVTNTRGFEDRVYRRGDWPEGEASEPAIEAEIKSASGSATMNYDIQREGDNITFVPTGVETILVEHKAPEGNRG
jgi:hypothetical protein